MENKTIYANVIYCHKSKKHYFDNGIIRFFEDVILNQVTFEEAQEKYPKIINLT